MALTCYEAEREINHRGVACLDTLSAGSMSPRMTTIGSNSELYYRSLP